MVRQNRHVQDPSDALLRKEDSTVFLLVGVQPQKQIAGTVAVDVDVVVFRRRLIGCAGTEGAGVLPHFSLLRNPRVVDLLGDSAEGRLKKFDHLFFRQIACF